MFALAEALGMTVERMAREMTLCEFMRWQAFRIWRANLAPSSASSSAPAPAPNLLDMPPDQAAALIMGANRGR